MSLLRIENLGVSVAGDPLVPNSPRLPVLHDISLQMQAGETLGLVGESGSGKSITALSILQLLPRPTVSLDRGAIYFEGQNLAELPANSLQQLRGNRIAMIFQDPMTALNPVLKVGFQIEEVLKLHRPDWPAAKRRQRVIELLHKVGMPAAQERLNAYPHQLSGGMRQRITIAMALACEPALLIADEPTTALDATVQSQVLGLINELQQQMGMAVLFITHDLGVIAETCQRVAVMYAGRIVEEATVDALFRQSRHPYTRALMRSLPALSPQPQQPLPAIPGQVPALSERPSGCAFSNRCDYRTDICAQLPPLILVGDTHRAACFHSDELSAQGNSHV